MLIFFNGTFVSRLKIDIPDNFSFSTEIPIMVQHINWGLHLGNDSHLAIIHEARVRYLQTLNISEKSIIHSIGLVLTDSYISYKKEVTHGDTLEVFVLMDHLTRLEADIYYKLVSKKTKEVIALAKTGCAFFDYEKRKLSPLPKEVVDKLIKLL